MPSTGSMASARKLFTLHHCINTSYISKSTRPFRRFLTLLRFCNGFCSSVFDPYFTPFVHASTSLHWIALDWTSLYTMVMRIQAVGAVPGLGLAANNGLAFSWPVEAGKERSWEVRIAFHSGSALIEVEV